jgi:outer membrane receptor protein involved in Fe transport
LRTVISERWAAFSNGAYKIAKVRETGSIISDISRFNGNAGLSYRPISRAAVKPNAQFVGRRGAAGGYWLMNSVVDLQVLENVTFSAIGNNLLDRRYAYPEHVRRIVDTLPGGPGRALYGRVTAEF